MNSPSVLPPDRNDRRDHCPLCGSDQFDLHTCGAAGCFVTQTCAVCGLSCRVVLGPESLPAAARLSEWAAVFAND